MSRRKNNNYSYDEGYNDLCSGFQNLSFGPGNSSGQNLGENRPFENPNYSLIDNSSSKPVWYRNVHPYEDTYNEVLDMITNESIIVENIVEVNNQFLQDAYKKKMRNKKRQYGEVYEHFLFHGTPKSNVDNICTYNFDWRLFGTNHGHRYGQGVSFSNNAKYASCYSDDGYNKVMIIAKVLITNVCKGHEDMTYPPPGYNASEKNNGTVVVKYDDNEFYPAYKLYYHFDDSSDESYFDEYDYYYYDYEDNYYYYDNYYY